SGSPRATTCPAGTPLGTRPPRVAHRVLGDGRRAPGRDHRHPRRRRRPAVPPPRERNRPERVRPWGPDVRPVVAAQRHAQLRWGQDVEVAGQHREGPRPGPGPPAGGAAPRVALGPLPPAPGLVGCAGRTVGAYARPAVWHL